jgi:hypothetical protein
VRRCDSRLEAWDGDKELFECEFGKAVLDELPEEKILDLSVLASDCSNELRPYAEDWLAVEYDEW